MPLTRFATVAMYGLQTSETHLTRCEAKWPALVTHIGCQGSGWTIWSVAMYTPVPVWA